MTIRVSHGSVKTQLRCGGMFNNNTTATCPQNVPVKNFENRSIFDEDMDNHKVGRFFETQCICIHEHAYDRLCNVKFAKFVHVAAIVCVQNFVRNGPHLTKL